MLSVVGSRSRGRKPLLIWTLLAPSTYKYVSLPVQNADETLAALPSRAEHVQPRAGRVQPPPRPTASRHVSSPLSSPSRARQAQIRPARARSLRRPSARPPPHVELRPPEPRRSPTPPPRRHDPHRRRPLERRRHPDREDPDRLQPRRRRPARPSSSASPPAPPAPLPAPSPSCSGLLRPPPHLLRREPGPASISAPEP